MPSVSQMPRGIARYVRAQLVVGPAVRRGDHVMLKRRGRVYVSTEDNRGQVLLARYAVTQPYVTWLWNRVADLLAPDVFCDIGANYGEVAFSRRYRPGEAVLLFEANPDLQPYLAKSCASRCDRQQLTIVPEFLGREGEELEFVIDEKWSGTSSAYTEVQDAWFKGEGEQTSRTIHVAARSLTSVFTELGIDADNKTVLIKLDVEGGEDAVLCGADDALRACANCVVITEVSKSAQHDSAALEEVLRAFARRGAIYGIQRGRTAKPLTASEAATYRDVLIVRGDRAVAALERVKRPWWI